MTLHHITGLPKHCSLTDASPTERRVTCELISNPSPKAMSRRARMPDGNSNRKDVIHAKDNTDLYRFGRREDIAPLQRLWCDVIGSQGRPWEVEMVCIQNLFAPIDFVRQFTGIPFQDIYNIVLRKGWTLGSEQMIRAMHFLMRISHGSQVKMLRQYWAQSQPDLVVSLIPHFNRAIKEALGVARPGVPFVTILTDIADHPPHFWIER